jgi:hypothetical protein
MESLSQNRQETRSFASDTFGVKVPLSQTLTLKFDGSNLGSIDKYVVKKFTNIDPKFCDSDTKLLNIITIRETGREISIVIYEFRNGAAERSSEIPIILDKFKPFFKIYRTRYHILYYEGVKYLAHEYNNEILIRDYLRIVELESSTPTLTRLATVDSKYENVGDTVASESENQSKRVSLVEINDSIFRPNMKLMLKYDVQKLFIFNWIMNVGSNTENRIWVKRLCLSKIADAYSVKHCSADAYSVIDDVSQSYDVYPFTFNEKSANIESTDESIDIPKKILEEWFDDDINVFIAKGRMMVRGMNLERLKLELDKILAVHNKNLSNWSNVIIANIRRLRN